VSSAGRPWACYTEAPNKTLALVEGVGYTASVAAHAVAMAAGETLIVPVDLVANLDDARPVTHEGIFEQCDEYWGTRDSDTVPPYEQTSRSCRPLRQRRPQPLPAFGL
jgi:hypothetical protein